MVETIITTVLPTFKRPALLKRAIESVLAQSYKELIVCVYDNASGDETEEIVKGYIKFDTRVRYYKNSENIGALANIKQGINAVTTPYYSLLSDDDFLLPDFYEKAMNAFEVTPSASAVCSKTMIIDLISKKIQFRNQDWTSGYYEPSIEVIAKMYSSHFVTTGVVLTKGLRDKIGTFDPSGSDLLYMTMASANAPFVVIDTYGAALTIHEQAYSMVAEGVSKESIPHLYSHVLLSVNNVLTMKISEEHKIHLMMLLVNFYHQIFDTKRLNHLLYKNHEVDIFSIMLLPSFINNRGLVAKIYDRTPLLLRPLLKYIYKAIKQYRQKKLGKDKQNWLSLSGDAHEMLINADTNILKLKSLLNNG